MGGLKHEKCDEKYPRHDDGFWNNGMYAMLHIKEDIRCTLSFEVVEFLKSHFKFISNCKLKVLFMFKFLEVDSKFITHQVFTVIFNFHFCK